MKKRKLMMLLCLMAIGAWLCPLHADTGPQKKLTRDAYVIWEPQLGDASQIISNSNATADGSDYANLIDNDVNTIFHSIWEADMALTTTTVDSWVAKLATLSGGINSDPGYHFLQVQLSEPASSFRFEYKGRNSDWHDNPNHIEIFATNDPGLWASPTNSNQDQWDKITELTPENTDFPEDVLVIDEAWQSPVITMPEAYQYIRFVVKGTTHQNKVDTRMFAVPEITGVTFNMSEFQIYVPRESTDPGDILQSLVDSVQNVWTSYQFEIGTDPGYVDSTKYASTYRLYEEALDALFLSLTDEEYTDYINRLRAAVTDFMTTGINQVETGYYNFVNAYPEYMNRQNTTMSMYVNPQKELAWTKSDSLSAMQLWYVEKLDSGRYSIKNVASGEYIGTIAGTSQRVPMTPAHQTDQCFEWMHMFPGQFHIYNVKNDVPYHTEDHNSGAGTAGRIVTYDGTGNSCSEWYMRRVTDQELIDKLVAEGPQTLLASVMNLALDSANMSRNKANEYTKLITSADQISSNAQSAGDGSAYANLIDNNTGTIFHSVWDAAFASPTLPGDSYGWHNLQFTLNEPISQIRFEFTGRNDASWCDTPNHITIYATNDDALGASTAAADSASWTQILDMTDDEYNFPARVALGYYSSPIIDLGGEYKYLRFVVKSTVNTVEGGGRYGAFTSPSATGVTFNLSEFQIYDPVPTEKSQYYTVPGMKEACDALEEAMTAAQEKLAAGTVTEADIAALQVAYRLVDSTYVDRNAQFNKLKELLESGENLYNNATGARVPLVNDVSQLSTNSDDKATSQLPNLIDGNTSSVFHSIWNTAMANPETTSQAWLDTIYNSYPMSTGTGYHNLNVSLVEPVSEFFFEFYSRPDANWHDNPSDIIVYATNDPELFADVRDSNTPQWTQITELTEGFPTGMTTEIPYTSPMIELGGEYKYIRFVIKNTCLANNPEDDPTIADTRNFAVPDITGITWNCSEFQLYTGLDPESIQYNYIEEVRVAADEMKELLDKYAEYTASDINSEEPVDELTAAVEKLREAYVDTNEVCDLYDDYKEILGREIYDGDLPGDVDDYSAVETFDATLDEARALIDPKRPTHEQVNTAMDMITSGYEEFMSHVILPQPYVWYVIRSGVKSESSQYAINQPIFLSSTSTGSKLSIGGYPEGGEWSDVYAIWRLVPVESNEPVAEGEEIKPWEQTFAIQSLGTGQYWGKYNGRGTANSPVMESEPTPYHIYFYGNGCFAMQQEGVEDPFDRIKADGTDKVICNYPANGGDQQSWKFESVAENGDGMVNINWFSANTTRIITLPFDLTGDNALKNLNDNIATYAVNSVTMDESAEGGEPSYTLTLTAKEEFEAGEPFIIETLAEPDANGNQPLWFSLPPEEADALVDTSAVDYNGLVGTLQGMTIKGQASLYFLNSVLNVATDAGYTLQGRDGYIDFTKVKDLGGQIDKTITINGVINDIQNVEIVEENSEFVDVYTIDGVLLKRNVKASEATDNLSKGIYIVGKKKVLVK